MPNNHTQDLKDKARERFERFREIFKFFDSHYPNAEVKYEELIFNELDTLIDRTVQLTEERIVGVIKSCVPKYPPNSLQEELAMQNYQETILSLITNKSDINKDKE